MTAPTIAYRSIREMVDHVIRDSVDNVAVFTPTVTDPKTARCYFVIATSGRSGFRCDQVIVDEQHDIRAAMLISFLALDRPFIVHDCDDELAAVKLCELLWPCKKVTDIRRSIEAERAARTQSL